MKRQLLDPLQLMLRLITLNFHDLNTKISIKDHRMNIQEPTNLQGFVRFFYKDGREDISELFLVVYRIIKWYILPSNEMLQLEANKKKNEKSAFDSPDNSTYAVNIKNSDVNLFDFSDDSQEDPFVTSIILSDENIKFYKIIRELVKYMCLGMERLQKTYASGNVIFSLQCYINLLNDALNGQYSDKKLPAFIMEEERKQKNFLDYDKIRKLWDSNKINRLYDLYDKCFTLMNEDGPDDEKRVNETLVAGYLEAINKLLDVTDEEFRKLIYLSNTG